jgi:hypothetical protein
MIGILAGYADVFEIHWHIPAICRFRQHFADADMRDGSIREIAAQDQILRNSPFKRPYADHSLFPSARSENMPIASAYLSLALIKTDRS